MITKNDLLILLSELQDNGIDTTQQFTRTITSKELPLDVIQFINSNRELDVNKFYEYIRKSYNEKKSKLYINIMKEIEDVNEVLTTLAALNLQILLFSKKVDDKQMFLRHARAEDITKVLTNYYQKFDLTNCVRLIHLIKADITTSEYLSGKREHII